MSNYYQLISRLESVIAKYESFMDAGEGDSLLQWLNSFLADFRIAASGRKGYASKLLLDADLTHDDGVLAEVTNDGVPENNGLYRKSGASGAGNWVLAPYDNFAVLEQKLNEATQALEDDLSYARGNIDSLLSSDSEKTQVYGIQNLPTKNGWTAASNLMGFCYAFNLDKSDVVKRFRFILDGLDFIDRIHVRIFSRETVSSYEGAPDTNQGDVLEDEFDHIPSGLPSSPAGVRVTVDVERTLNVDSDRYYLVELTTFNVADQAVPVGTIANSFDTSSNKTLAGYYNNGSAWVGHNAASAHFEVFADRVVDYTDKLSYMQSVLSTIEEALGYESIPLESDVQNKNEQFGVWSANFWGWGVIREFEKNEYLYGIEFFLNMKDAEVRSTSQCRISVYEGDQTIDRSNFERFPLVHMSKQSVTLVDTSPPLLFKLGMVVKADKRYVFVVEGLDDNDNPSVIGSLSSDFTGMDNTLKGIYKVEDGASWSTAGGASVLARTYGYSAYINKGMVDDVLENFEQVKVVKASRPHLNSGWSALPAEFVSWAVSYTPSESIKATKFRLFLDNVAACEGIRFQVFQRDKAVGDGVPGEVAGDVAILDLILSPAELGVSSNVFQSVEFDVSAIEEFSPDFMYLFKVEAVNGFIGAGRSYGDIADTEKSRRGYYALNGYGSMSVISPSGSLAWDLFGERYQLKVSESRSLLHPVVTARTKVAGNVVTIPEVKINRTGRSVLTQNESFICRAPYSESKTITTSLIYDESGSWFLNANENIEHRYIRNVIVKNTSTQAVLIEDEDYGVFFDGGKVFGKKDVASYSVDVSYAGYYSRYDLIECDPITGSLNYVEGTDRIYDPEEYLPEVTAGMLPLFHVFVYADSVQLIPLYNSNGGVLDSFENEYTRMSEQNKKCLRKTLGKLNSGAPINLVGYGDSITAQGGGVWQTPNGVSRDTVSYYGAYPADTEATYELFDHDDGAGQVHQHNGWNWHLKTGLEDRFGVVVNYLNFGIGGTNSSDRVDPDGVRHGGLNPDRLNAMLASNPDLVVIAFGMNEIGSAGSTVQVISIIEAIQAAGGEVIVMGCPRINELGGRAELEKWSETNHRLWTAAQHTGSAYLSTEYYQGDQHLGYMGLSPHSFCNANVYNHPGRYELKKIGEALAGIFD